MFYLNFKIGIIIIPMPKNHVIQIKASWNKPLFSERNGIVKFPIRFMGWRVRYINLKNGDVI